RLGDREHLLAGAHARVALDHEVDAGELDGHRVDHGFGGGPATVRDDEDGAASRLVTLHGPALPPSEIGPRLRGRQRHRYHTDRAAASRAAATAMAGARGAV